MPAEEEEPAPEVLERVSRSALVGGILLLLIFLFASLISFWIFTDSLKAPQPVDFRHYIVALLASGAVLATSIPQIISKYVRWGFSAPHVLVPAIAAGVGALLFAIPFLQLPSPPALTLLGTPVEAFYFVGVAAVHGLAMIGYPMTQRMKWSMLLQGISFVPMIVTLIFAILAVATNRPQDASLGSINLAIAVSLTGYTMAITAFTYHYTTISTTLVRVESVVEADEGEVKHLKQEIKIRNERIQHLKDFAASLESVEARAVAKTLGYANDDDPVLIALKSNIAKLISRSASGEVPAMPAATAVGPKSEKAAAKGHDDLMRTKEKELKDLEWELDRRTKELDRKMADVVKRETEAAKAAESAAVRLKEADMRNSALKAQEERTSAMVKDAEEKSAKARSLNDEARTKHMEAQAKEKMIQDREKEIMKADAEMRRRERESEARAGDLRRLEDDLKKREEALKSEHAKMREEQVRMAEKNAEIKAAESSMALRAKTFESAAADSESARAMMKRIEEQNQQIIQKEKENAVLKGKLEETQRELSTAMKFAEDKRQHYERSIGELGAREKTLAEREADAQIAKSKLESQQRELLKLRADMETEKRSMEEKRGPGMLTRIQKGQEMDARIKEQDAEFRKKLDAVAIDPGLADSGAQEGSSPATPAMKVDEAEKSVDELAARISRLASAAKGPAAAPETPAGPAAAAPSPVAQARPMAGLTFGVPRLEELMGGDLPRGQTLLLSGPPFTGKDVLIARAVSTSILNGIPVVFVTTSRPAEEWGKELLAVDQGHLSHMRSGMVKWLDLVSAAPPAGNAYAGNVSLLTGSAGLEEILATVRTKSPGKGRFLLVVASLSSLLQKSGVGPVQEWLRKLLALVRERDGNGLVSMERGTHTDQEYEAIVSVLHGVLSMKKEGTKTLLQLEGLEKQASKEWVEYTVEGKAFKLGAFSLERIR
jgi:KaiC/GvpD/RAD55 family RecA-like ATPase